MTRNEHYSETDIIWSITVSLRALYISILVPHHVKSRLDIVYV